MSLPFVLGVEGAGEIQALGPNTALPAGLALGDRVVYYGPRTGSYAGQCV